MLDGRNPRWRLAVTHIIPDFSAIVAREKAAPKGGLRQYSLASMMVSTR